MQVPAKKRIFCVDLLRGIDIFYLLVIHYAILAPGVFCVWPLESVSAKAFWLHSLTAFAEPGQTPTGFGLLDCTQPLFIFVTGVSASLAFRKFARPDGGVDLALFWKGLAKRVLMLWALGSAIRGILTFRLFTGPDAGLSFVFYSDTLHTIAVAYCAASLGLLLRRQWQRLALAAALVGAAALVLACCGDYSRLGNAARIFEDFVYGKIGGHAKNFCYLLTTLTWAGMGVFASLAGDVLKGSLAPWAKVRLLAFAGAALLAGGWIVSFWIPPIRYIYTLSFVLETQGGAMILLAVLFALTDIGNWRRGTGLLILFGQCSLAAWMTVNFFGDALTSAASRFVVGMPRLLGTSTYQPLFVSAARAVVLVALVAMWRTWRLAAKSGSRLEGRRSS